MIKRFLIYGMLGWSMEVLWTGFLSALAGDWRLTSTTYLWMFPIYGLAVLLEPVHHSIRSLPWWLRGCIWVAAIWLIEAGSGFVIKTITGKIPWDYTGQSPWQIAGLIRLDMAPLWFIVGFLFERLHDFLEHKVALQ
ncbi:membrane protein [Desulfotomaculum varum]